MWRRNIVRRLDRGRVQTPHQPTMTWVYSWLHRKVSEKSLFQDLGPKAPWAIDEMFQNFTKGSCMQVLNRCKGFTNLMACKYEGANAVFYKKIFGDEISNSIVISHRPVRCGWICQAIGLILCILGDEP